MTIMNNIKEIKRNDKGLIEGLSYKIDETGMIDWKSMIPSEFLYVNPDLKRREKLEKKYNKNYNDIDPILDNVEDSDLIMMLGATKYLLRIRGFSKVSVPPVVSNDNYASVHCTIDFIPNFESEGRPISYSENACAHPGNTNGFGQKYLLEMATNRALARCVRNFLNINIVSKEELGSNNIEEEENKIITPNPYKILEDLMVSKKTSIEDLNKKFNSKDSDTKWSKVSDIPKLKMFQIIGEMKK